MILIKDFGVIQIFGKDALAFLQRQFTNDVSRVDQKTSSLGAYLTPKGRVIANFMMVSHNGTILLILDKDLLEVVSKRLKIFVMRDKVDVAITDFVVSGQYYEKFSGSSRNLLPSEQYGTITHDGLTFVRVPGTKPRFLLIGSKAAMQAQFVSSECSQSEAWKLADIDCGIALVGKATSEKLVPQAINLDLVGGVSFKKGCYPGQEIVARLHYRGGVNRRLIRASVSAEANVEPGTLVQCRAIPGNQTAMVINWARSRDLKTQQLLLSTPLRFLPHKVLQLDNGQSVTLLLDQLPYSLPEVSE